MGTMLMLDRFKINQHKFNNSLGTLGYHHNLKIFPSMACEILIEGSSCPLKTVGGGGKSKKESTGLSKPQIM